MNTRWRPQSAEETRALVARLAGENTPFWIRGAGTRAGFPQGVILETGDLRQVRFFEPQDMVVGVESGFLVEELVAMVQAAGMELPFNPWFAGSTVGGLVAANGWGPQRMDRGGVRDSLIGIEYVTGASTLAHAGGKVVKNVTGYDLAKMMVGSLGGLGVITALHLKLQPGLLEPHTAFGSQRGQHWLEWLLDGVHASGLPLDWVQAVHRDGAWVLGMGYSGRSARRARLRGELDRAFEDLTHRADEDLGAEDWFYPKARHSGFLEAHRPDGDFVHVHVRAPTAAFLKKPKILAMLCGVPGASVVFHPIGADAHLLAPVAAFADGELDGLRRALSGTGGYLVLERVPEGMRQTWGEVVPLPSEYRLQQGLKRHLDPKGLFRAPFYD